MLASGTEMLHSLSSIDQIRAAHPNQKAAPNSHCIHPSTPVIDDIEHRGSAIACEFIR
jgi:hypothetical protein